MGEAKFKVGDPVRFKNGRFPGDSEVKEIMYRELCIFYTIEALDGMKYIVKEEQLKKIS